MRPALILDRDGVINVDRKFVHRVEDFAFQPGIFELARAAVACAMPIVVVTNQSGIGLGYYTAEDFAIVTAHMCAGFDAAGAPIAAVYHCPFHPNAASPRYRSANHPWRKPRPGMILAARNDLDLDLARSILIGDRWSDIEAGSAAGVGTLVLVGATRPKPEHDRSISVHRFATIEQTADWFTARSAKVA